MLSQYGPHLLVTCDNVTELAQQCVETWLHQYMFRKAEGGREKAKTISKWLSDHSHFKTHARHIGRSRLKRKGMNISFLEQDQQFQDLVLSVFHATTHTFSGTSAVKIIENHLGKAFIKQQVQQAIQIPAAMLQPMKPPAGAPPSNAPSKKS